MVIVIIGYLQGLNLTVSLYRRCFFRTLHGCAVCPVSAG